MDEQQPDAEIQRKASYVGAPAIFALNLACAQINEAFEGFGCFHVGSSLKRSDWRDVDIRFIMEDEEFAALFPSAGDPQHCHWELDTRWLLLTTSISGYLSKVSGLPVDFQFHPQSWANKRFGDGHSRNAMGVRLPRTRQKKKKKKG